MNADIFQGQWKQVKGRIKESWGDLTDDEVDQMEGNYDSFVGTLQEKYGWKRVEAERRIEEAFADDEW